MENPGTFGSVTPFFSNSLIDGRAYCSAKLRMNWMFLLSTNPTLLDFTVAIRLVLDTFPYTCQPARDAKATALTSMSKTMASTYRDEPVVFCT